MISFQLCVLAILVEWEVHSVTGHSPIYPCIACSIDSFVSRHSFMQDFIRFRCRSRRIDHLLRRAWIAFVIISWWLGVKSSAWTPSQKLKVKFLQRKRTGRKVYALKGVHKNQKFENESRNIRIAKFGFAKTFIFAFRLPRNLSLTVFPLIV